MLLALLLLPLEAGAFDAFIDKLPNGNKVPDVRALGHVSRSGAGPLNPFGADFKANNQLWSQALCLKDSDGDGEYNGWELGDICCQWVGGDRSPVLPAGRPLSHPGEADSRSGAALPPGFNLRSLAESAPTLGLAAFKQHGLVCSEPPAPVVKEARSAFWDYVLAVSPYNVGPGLSLLVFTCYCAICCRPGGVKDLLHAPLPHRIGVICVSAAYAELISGLLHVFADNEAFLNLPFFGQLVTGFIFHHDEPTWICKGQTWPEFLGAINSGMILLMLGGLICQKRYVRYFVITASPLMYLMMASHRWAHYAPNDTPAVVRWLQSAGVLLPPATHMVHHADHSLNFSLLSGWSNGLINALTVYVANPKNVVWFPVFIGFALVTPLLPYVPGVRSLVPEELRTPAWKKVKNLKQRV